MRTVLLYQETRHLLLEKALKFLMYLFFGFIVAYAIWFVFLPQNISDILLTICVFYSNIITDNNRLIYFSG